MTKTIFGRILDRCPIGSGMTSGGIRSMTRGETGTTTRGDTETTTRGETGTMTSGGIRTTTRGDTETTTSGGIRTTTRRETGTTTATRRAGAAVLLAMVLLTGCETIQSLIHDDKVVAKVGKHKLYQSEVDAYIPSGVSLADSTNLALQYINTWATDLIFCDMAQSQLSKAERDVSAELEAYKRDLLRFRYEQRFVSDRLDTLITEDQMQNFYDAHKSMFVLDRPIMKVRFVSILKNAEKKDQIIRLMSSNKPKDMEELEGMANKYAIRYFDKSYEWMDAAVLAREFGTDYGQMLARMSQSYIRMESEESSDIKVAYVREIRRSGVAPFDFCTDRIREYILSGRKHDLLVALEQSLLKGASDDGQFVIY